MGKSLNLYYCAFFKDYFRSLDAHSIYESKHDKCLGVLGVKWGQGDAGDLGLKGEGANTKNT